MMAKGIINKPSKVEYSKLKCLILDAPNDYSMHTYVEEMLNYGVTNLVRTCESTYNDSAIQSAGIEINELIFPDGESPPPEIVDRWLKLVTKVMNQKGSVAVHCVAGLGRAPVLVAVALIEKCNMDPLDAIMFIRERRKGAINRRQLQFLREYKRQVHQGGCLIHKGCSIM